MTILPLMVVCHQKREEKGHERTEEKGGRGICVRSFLIFLVKNPCCELKHNITSCACAYRFLALPCICVGAEVPRARQAAGRILLPCVGAPRPLPPHMHGGSEAVGRFCTSYYSYPPETIRTCKLAHANNLIDFQVAARYVQASRLAA